MLPTPPSIARTKTIRQMRHQDGVILSKTVVMHPAAGFPSGKRCIGLIELNNGTKVMGQLTNEAAQIGQHVQPRIRLMRTNEQGLKVYDTVYEPLALDQQPVQNKSAFPGYILVLSGPSGVGKSTVKQLLLKMLPDAAATVPIVTSNRDIEEAEYQFIEKEAFLQEVHSGEIIASVQRGNHFCGYRKKDIEAIWNSSSIPVVTSDKELLTELSRYYGRRSILSCGLLPPGSSKRTMLSCLLHRWRKKDKKSSTQITQDLQHAKGEISFFEQRADLFDHVIVNENLETVAATLKGHIAAKQRGDV